MKVSVIIPTYNKLPRLKLTLISIENQTCNKSDFEVIVIDNNSTDGTGEYLRSQDFDFDFTYCLEKRLGRSFGRNLGVRTAKNPLLIFIDDDMLLPDMFIEKHINAQMEKSAVVHGKIFNIINLKFFSDPVNSVFYDAFDADKDKLQLLTKKCITSNDVRFGMDKIASQNIKTTQFEKLVSDVFNQKLHEFVWIGFTGGNVSVLKEWVLRCGAFDERFGMGWGYEDVELGYRIWKDNVEFTYCDVAANYHMDHYRFNFYEESRNTSDHFYQKHNDDKIKLFIDFSLGKYGLEDTIMRFKNFICNQS